MRVFKFTLKTALLVVFVLACLFTAWSSDQRRREAETMIRMMKAERSHWEETEFAEYRVRMEAMAKVLAKSPELAMEAQHAANRATDEFRKDAGLPLYEY